MRNHGIYELDLGQEESFFIDLGKIITVSKARFVNMMGCGGYFAEANIKVQLSTPVSISLRQEFEYSDPERIRIRPVCNEAGVPTQVAFLQEQLDKLVAAWKEFNSHD